MKTLFKMNKLQEGVAAAIVSGVLLASGAVQAAPSLIPDSYRMKYTTFEQLSDKLVDANGDFLAPAIGTGYANGIQDLRGLFYVTDIYQPSGNLAPIWSAGPGDYLWGVFYGLDLARVSPGGTGGFELGYVGGELALYNKTTTFDPFITGVAEWTGLAATSGTYKSINDTDGDGTADVTPWLTAKFDTGISNSAFHPQFPANLLDTLLVKIDALTYPASGKGNGDLSVGTVAVGTGTQNSSFDTNKVVTPQGLRDAALANDFTSAVDSDGDGLDDSKFFPIEINPLSGKDLFKGKWHVAGEDPVTGFVPEPASIALLGLGLLGLGFSRRNKKTA